MTTINKKGYVHWVTPLVVMLGAIGYYTATLLGSRIASIVFLLITGGVSGHLMYNKTKVSVYSAFLLVIGFVLGYAWKNQTMSNVAIFVIFFAAFTAVYFYDKAKDKS